ncbi:metal-sensitive transcriptional regulator [Actinomyces sp. B33]|uniref:metal-sensitive transcriptional regulator n=1 Tax=Actinomyces sp. B33 TaxID=2942131 RepID=UPI002341BEFC|nr:metal-sensitive transcriptional regulator [Actinomyces sp. B33]MDC4233734.1 metal-sensitive transcriptional regulator [Actinomyces sp. B33]
MHLTSDQSAPVLNRLKRARGQFDAVIRMVEEGRDCREVVTQLSACSKAVDRAGFALISTALRTCAVEDEEHREENIAALEKLFLTLS